MRRFINAFVLLVTFNSSILSANQSIAFDASSLSSDGRQAYLKLLRAPMFSIGPVGFAAQVSESELALRALLNEREVIPALKDLVAKASTEGKMYALYGLHLKDREIFKQEAEQYKKQQEAGTKVSTQSGCIVMQEQGDFIVAQIEAGQYDLYFKASQSRN